ncbi:MAG TPA: MmcQ/YjbR family DNA-binding protein [Gaiellaceae bacterium]
MPVTLDDVRELALSLPRSYEAVVRGRVKFRVGQIVYLAFSHDRETMGFGFPKELRDALVQSEPHKFSLPSQSDMRFNWAEVRLAAIDADEMCDLVEGAWAMCVPKRVAAEYAASQGYPVER